MNKNKFKIYTLGCKVNQYDSSDLRKKLEAGSFNFVNKNADWAIVNTCAVTKNAIKKDRQMIIKAKKENPGAKIIIAGCFSKIYKTEAKKLGADFLFEVGERDKIAETIINYELKIKNYEKIKNLYSSTQKKSKNSFEKVRYFLKIQDGCEQYCTYCIIPYTRGKLKSRGIDEVVEEASKAIQLGCREVVLTGIHLGLYGQEVKSQKSKVKSINTDLKAENKLVDLIRELTRINSLLRVRLSSIEVNEVCDELIKLIKENKKLCPHLHIPLQSGSDKILKLMNRPYDKNIFERKIRRIRKLIPNISITTDVIVGFPGESDKEFKETCSFIKKIKFSGLHVFPFSAHEKTPAFKLPDQVNENLKLKRAEILRKLGEELDSNYRKRFEGKKVEVLVENITDGIARGKSDNYLDVKTLIKRRLTKETKQLNVGEVVQLTIIN